ncbi:MAG: hypothetical protein LBC81_03620 [Tannerellaceae bacterium]|jgi:hypothetical protein|nr:hypothetical protein [Tannerellaceae bacterium]
MKPRLQFLLLGLIITQLLRAQSPEQLQSLLPSVEGWTVGGIEVFNPDNLYDRINGAAPLFLANNFREMTAVDYRRGNDYITLQAYRHGSPQDAFGMYASERSPDIPFLTAIGGEAQGDAENLFFFAGSIYVKIASHSEADVSAVMQSIARSFADKIEPRPSYPEKLSCLPEKNRIPRSEAYINSSYMGHDFLKSVYTASYNADGKEYQVFIIDGGSAEGAKGILKQYFAFTKQTAEIKEGPITITDRYNGNIPAYLKGSYIAGVCSDSGSLPANAEAIAAQTASSVK